MKPNERRQAIWEALCHRRHDTASHLASEFGVSERTIWYDIEQLMLSHPIEAVCGRHGGGIKVSDCYQPKRRALNPEQTALLKKLAASLGDSERKVMNSIIVQFAP